MPRFSGEPAVRSSWAGADGCGGPWSPSILDVLNRANLLASLQHQRHAPLYADVQIAPLPRNEGFAAFDRVGKLAEIGYRTTMDVLERTEFSIV